MDNQPVTYTPSEATDLVNDIKFSDVKVTQSGGKIIFASVNDEPLYLRSDKLTMPFDASFFSDNDSSDNGKLQFTVNIDPDSSETNKHMCQFAEAVDKKVCEEAMKNHVQWLKLAKNKANKDAIEDRYTSMKRVSLDPETGEPDGKYPPSFRFKVPKNKGKWECKVFDHNRKEILINNMSNEEVFALFPKKSTIKVLLKLTVVWVAGSKFGVSWKAEQIKVDKPKTLDSYAFQDSDEDDDLETDEDTEEDEVVNRD
jgi:hypothetical protein